MLGPTDRNLKMIREALGVRITSRDGSVRVTGPHVAVAAARDVLRSLEQSAARQEAPSRQQVMDLLTRAMSDAEEKEELAEFVGDGTALDGPAWGDRLDVYAGGRAIKARTPNQQVYLDAIRDHDVVFGIGPAGTGKTYLAVAAAVHMLKSGRVKKVILVRPAVEAGEKLGFLPGDIAAKVNPYLRPLFDALHDMMDFHTIQRFVASDVVEIVPLAYMRGRTLNRSVILLDEAQNTTKSQMKMFLTRMGLGSKVIVTGDPTQIDLPHPDQSGLIEAVRLLKRVNGVGMVHLSELDIVRHPMVQRIVEAYGAADNQRERPKLPTTPPDQQSMDNRTDGIGH
jgi:phosphate starvation-inducible PhoH-like protein